MASIKVKNPETGAWTSLPGIPGKDGKSAYAAAMEAGYAGTEQEFSEALAAVDDKQDKLTGTPGQVVGFDETGAAVAQAAPQTGLTQAEADGRYLQLSGGTVTGDLAFLDGVPLYFGNDKNHFLIYDNALGGLILMGDRIFLRGAVVTDGPTDDNEYTVANKGYVDSLIPRQTAVTLTAGGWDATAKTQTVTVAGVVADEAKQLILPVPALSSQTAYIEAGILCTVQAANSLTFLAGTVPTEDLTVYVVVQGVAG